MNIPPSISLTRQELYGALLLWTTQGRMGKNLDQLDVDEESVEEVADGNATFLWDLFGGKRTSIPVAFVQGQATAPAKPELAPGETYCCLMPARGELRAYHLIFGAESPEQLTYGPDDTIDNANDHYDGAANTAALLASGKPHPAAAYCRGMGEQWYLPAHAEMMAAFVHSPESFNKEGYYWSSTQDGHYYAWVQDFEYGSSYGSYKGLKRRVRPARRSFI